MSTKNTSISWTDTTWNPTRGCSRVSAGCDKCYAIGQAHRFAGVGGAYEGLTIVRPSTAKRPGRDWSGIVRLIPETLAEPLAWKQPARIFVNSMSDLFHESLLDEEIAAVFGVMAACPQHTFQILTKRAERMRAWFAWVARKGALDTIEACAEDILPERVKRPWGPEATAWPLPGVWLGVSAENQETANERIPDLLATPAAVRFVSAEPLLGPIDLMSVPLPHDDSPVAWCDTCKRPRPAEWLDSIPLCTSCDAPLPHVPDWLIAGGESGNGARPSEVEWYRDLQRQCFDLEISFFLKQFGRYPLVREVKTDGLHGDALRAAAEEPFREWPDGTHFGNPISKSRPDLNGRVVMLREPKKKGSDMNEWPESFRVQEFPETTKPAFADSSGS